MFRTRISRIDELPVGTTLVVVRGCGQGKAIPVPTINTEVLATLNQVQGRVPPSLYFDFLFLEKLTYYKNGNYYAV